MARWRIKHYVPDGCVHNGRHLRGNAGDYTDSDGLCRRTALYDFEHGDHDRRDDSKAYTTGSYPRQRGSSVQHRSELNSLSCR